LEEYKLKNCTTLFSFYFAYSLRHFACHLWNQIVLHRDCPNKILH
jgi:hypothetical protein